MDSSRLRRVLDSARAELETGLAEAEAELERLERRRSEVVALIVRAKAALGEVSSSSVDTVTPPVDARPPTLHEAMAQVLRSRGNEPMAARDLASEVNRRGAYHKRDQSPVEVNQIHARVHNYGDMFEKVGPLIRLRAS
jgi:hypothetical protein